MWKKTNEKSKGSKLYYQRARRLTSYRPWSQTLAQNGSPNGWPPPPQYLNHYHHYPRAWKTCKDTVGNFKDVCSSRETFRIITLCDSSVQLPEIWKGCRSHPNQEILIDEAVVSRVFGVEFISGFGPQRRLHSTWNSNLFVDDFRQSN